MAGPQRGFTAAFGPLIHHLNSTARRAVRRLGLEPSEELLSVRTPAELASLAEVASVFTDDKLARMVRSSSAAGLLSPQDGKRLRDALEMGTQPAGEIFVPAPKMVTVHDTIIPAELECVAAGSGFSRFPVTGTVVGYFHIKDTLGVMNHDQPFLRSAAHAVNRVQIDTSLDDTLTALRASGSHLAAVTVDTVRVLGFVTMEDVLGELVGPAA